MNTSTSVYAISTSLFLLGLVYLLFWKVRVLAEDWFRDQVFELRDNLFDEAATGLISFDNLAYTTLRMTMNGYIRFCHKFSLLHILVFSLLSEKSSPEEGVFSRNWKIATKDLPADISKKLEGYRKQMELLMITYLIFSSPFISIFFSFLLGFGFLIKSVADTRKKIVFDWADKIRNLNSTQPFLRSIDDTAYATGAL